MTHGGEQLEVLRVVSMRGAGLPGWYIFKQLEDDPNALGVVDGPFPSADMAQLEARLMKRRRRLLGEVR